MLFVHPLHRDEMSDLDDPNGGLKEIVSLE